ncbi:MAG: fatty acid desaturase family protein [Burkholderiaceae bacterium]
MSEQIKHGEEFRDDARPVSGAVAGSANAQARKALSPQELRELTQLDPVRSTLAVLRTFVPIVLAAAVALYVNAWYVTLAAIIVIGVSQHAMFVLAHESAHYRLFETRWLNDLIGRFCGVTGGISMCTYRITHRLHHNHLYGPEDPDTAIHGGYPRGKAYLWKKLAQDLVGWNAWKTFAYFFGAPALNTATNQSIRPLDDTSPTLRRAAQIDRWLVVAFHIAAPVVAWLLFDGYGLLMYLLLWVVPLVTVLQPVLRLRAIAEHGAVTDLSSPLTAARTNQLTGPFGLLVRAVFFPHHVNYHLEHHLYPAVPHYNLPKVHDMLEARGFLAAAEVKPFSATMAQIFAPRRSKEQRLTTASETS